MLEKLSFAKSKREHENLRSASESAHIRKSQLDSDDQSSLWSRLRNKILFYLSRHVHNASESPEGG